jgi:hypothetical protein
LKLLFETANSLTDPIARCERNVLFLLDVDSISSFSMHWRSANFAMVGDGILASEEGTVQDSLEYWSGKWAFANIIRGTETKIRIEVLR